MKRLPLVLVAAALLLPGAAQGAACSPLNCAASQFSLGHGSLLGFRANAEGPVTIVDLKTGKTRWALPSGVTNGNLLVHQAGSTLVWYDAMRGARLYSVTLDDGYQLVGVSQDGTRAVATRTRDGRTELLVVSRSAHRSLSFPSSRWQFDALRGDNLFLIRNLETGGYQIRLAHVGSGGLEARPLKDPRESSTIWGSPFSRLSSPDGRYLFTLYVGGNGGAMVHALDLQNARARCIDLPGTGDFLSAASWALTTSADGRTLWAVSPGYGRVVAIDVASREVTTAFGIDRAGWRLGSGVSAVLSPDGTRLALADRASIAVVDVAAQRIVKRDFRQALALGYSPDGSRLWNWS
jgi:hypothetical protein